MDVLVNPAVFVSLRNRSLMRHMPGLVCFSLLYSSRKKWQLKLGPRQTTSSPAFVINQWPPLSHLCSHDCWPTWYPQPFLFILPISFKLHSPADSDHVLNSQATDTLPTLAMEDVICFRGSGRSHLLKHMTGNSIRSRGSGARGSLELGRGWKEFSQKFKSLAHDIKGLLIV